MRRFCRAAVFQGCALRWVNGWPFGPKGKDRVGGSYQGCALRWVNYFPPTNVSTRIPFSSTRAITAPVSAVCSTRPRLA